MVDQPPDTRAAALTKAFSTMQQKLHIDDFNPRPLPGQLLILPSPDKHSEAFKQLLGKLGSVFNLHICLGPCLNRLQTPLYLELALHKQTILVDFITTNRQILDLWRNLSPAGRESKNIENAIQRALDTGTMAQLQAPNPIHPHRRRIFLLADMSFPGGYLWTRLLPNENPIRYLTAFFLHIWGFENPRCCRPCAERFLSHTVRSNDHVMAPFWGCVSVPGIYHGACTNCIWHDTADCDYQSVDREGWPIDGKTVAPESRQIDALAQAPRTMNLGKWSVFDIGRASIELKTILSRAKKDQRKNQRVD